MSDEDKRHLRPVPDLLEIKCVFADGDDGPCGGPTTQKGDGTDYCWDHKDLVWSQ